MAMKYVGSIYLSDIPKELIKKIGRKSKNGEEKDDVLVLNISIHENNKPFYNEKGELISDHFISCAPKKDERVEGKNYIIGNLRTWQEQSAPAIPTAEEIAAAPAISEEEATDLPF